MLGIEALARELYDRGVRDVVGILGKESFSSAWRCSRQALDLPTAEGYGLRCKGPSPRGGDRGRSHEEGKMSNYEDFRLAVAPMMDWTD